MTSNTISVQAGDGDRNKPTLENIILFFMFVIPGGNRYDFECVLRNCYCIFIYVYVSDCMDKLALIGYNQTSSVISMLKELQWDTLELTDDA